MALPWELSSTSAGILRPADLRPRYAHPAKEFRRFRDQGAIKRLAHGYYVVVPERYRRTAWRPSVEAAALGIAQADYGVDGAVGMGITAVRLLGRLARAPGTAQIAIAGQRPPLNTAAGLIRFVTRRLGSLDVQRAETEIGSAWITTPGQTILDLADKPDRVPLPFAETSDAIVQLSADADWPLIADLAQRQRKGPAALRAARVAGIDASMKGPRDVDMKGLVSDVERRRLGHVSTTSAHRDDERAVGSVWTDSNRPSAAAHRPPRTMADVPKLAETSLTDVQQRVVEAFVHSLRDRLGDGLRSVWLFGSRARGDESGPSSDVDLLVVSDGGSKIDGPIATEVMSLVAFEAGTDPFQFTTIVWDPAWLKRRREIRSFFIQEVDRDKIVLYGEP